jgi:hypothetical protein
MIKKADDEETAEERAEDETEMQAAPPKQGTWIGSAFIIIAFQIGVGIMSLPLIYKSLGYVLGTFSVFIWGIVAISSGIALVYVKSVWETSLCFSDVAYHAFQSCCAQRLVGGLVYFNFFLLLGRE